MKCDKKAQQKQMNSRKVTQRNLVCSADASERLGWHSMDRLILADTERIFVADKGLRVKLERFAHQLGNSVN